MKSSQPLIDVDVIMKDKQAQFDAELSKSAE